MCVCWRLFRISKLTHVDRLRISASINCWRCFRDVDDRKYNQQKCASTKNVSSSSSSSNHKTTGKSSSVHNIASSRARMADENSPRKTGARKASNVDEFSNDEYDHCDEFAENKSAYLLRNRGKLSTLFHRLY